jgi:hypothetical protein
MPPALLFLLITKDFIFTNLVHLHCLSLGTAQYYEHVACLVGVFIVNSVLSFYLSCPSKRHIPSVSQPTYISLIIHSFQVIYFSILKIFVVFLLYH